MLAVWPRLPFWAAVLVLHLAMLVMPFYVTLTAQVREFVPAERLGRAITSLYLFGLSAAFLAQWLTGLLVGLSAEPGRIGSPLGYRLVFAFLAAMLLGTLLIYRRAPERRRRNRRCGAAGTALFGAPIGGWDREGEAAPALRSRGLAVAASGRRGAAW